MVVTDRPRTSATGIRQALEAFRQEGPHTYRNVLPNRLYEFSLRMGSHFPWDPVQVETYRLHISL